MKNRLLLIIGLFSLILYSCNDNKTNQENILLQKKVLQLESEIDDLRHESIIISYDSITNYIMPTTFHPEIKVNEKGEFRTALEWRKLPEKIKVECVVKSNNARIIEIPNDGLYRTVEVEFSSPGEKLIEGYYSITFPNGLVKKYEWRAYPNVIK
jgi:hypothetical protein